MIFPEPRRTNRGLTVLGLILALAMGALEATVVSTAMPTVIGELGGIRYYAWVTNAYLLTSSVTVPIYGKLADTYGRKPILLFGIAAFLFGSAASGAAQSMGQLIVFRAIQGLGAGSMQPMALTIVGDIFDLQERSRIQGVFGAAWGLFGLIGPLLGGFIVEHFSWRWVFYMNLPFGVAAAALVMGSLAETIEKKDHTLDFLGAGLLMIGMTALLAAASRAGAVVTAVAAVIAAVALTLFFAVERRAPEPVLPLPLFARPVILISSLAGAIVGGAMVAMVTYVPLFVQGALHGSPTDAGQAITPMVLGWPIASTIAGRLLPRVGFRPLIWAGLGITAVSAIALPLFGATHGLAGLRVTSACFGVGMGLANTALLIVVQTSVAWNQRGIATASTMFFRTIGGALAVGVMGGVINAAIARDPSISPDIASSVLHVERGKAIDPVMLDRVGAALAYGLGHVFWIIAGMAAAAFLASLFFPHVPTTAPPPGASTEAAGH
jgi:EmrB/QacA subfamily drug resistance transporter